MELRSTSTFGTRAISTLTGRFVAYAPNRSYGRGPDPSPNVREGLPNVTVTRGHSTRWETTYARRSRSSTSRLPPSQYITNKVSQVVGLEVNILGQPIDLYITVAAPGTIVYTEAYQSCSYQCIFQWRRDGCQVLS